MDDLTDAIVPKSITLKRSLHLPKASGEFEMLTELHRIANENKIYKSYIGTGYYDCILPAVIRRNMLENAGWSVMNICSDEALSRFNLNLDMVGRDGKHE